MSRFYGKPSTYPFYVHIYKNGKLQTESGVFKTKKEAIKFAKKFTKNGKIGTYKVLKRKSRR